MIMTRADYSGRCHPSAVVPGSLVSWLPMKHSKVTPLESNALINFHCCPQDLSTVSLYLKHVPLSEIITPPTQTPAPGVRESQLPHLCLPRDTQAS